MAKIVAFELALCHSTATVARNFETVTTRWCSRSPNIGQEEDAKLQKAIREVSKRECVIMGDFNHGHIQWESLESAGGYDHQFHR